MREESPGKYLGSLRERASGYLEGRMYCTESKSAKEAVVMMQVLVLVIVIVPRWC